MDGITDVVQPPMYSSYAVPEDRVRAFATSLGAAFRLEDSDNT